MRFSVWRHTILAAGLACGAAALIVSGCGPADPERTTVKPAQTAADRPARTPVPAPVSEDEESPKLGLVQKDVTLRWVENGAVRMSATAREFRGNEVTRKGELLDFSAQLYENGKPTTTLTAPRVIADTANRVVTATGGVVMKSLVRHTVVKSEWAKWYQKRQQVVGNGGVTIKSDQWDANAAAFVADTGLKTVSLRDSAKGL